jgi:hypothetical protein
VIEHGQLAAEAARHRAAVEHLLRVSSELTTGRSRAEMLRAVCEGIRDALGFELAGVFLDEAGMPTVYTSHNNGRGPRAWKHRWLSLRVPGRRDELQARPAAAHRLGASSRSAAASTASRAACGSSTAASPASLRISFTR